MGHTHNPFHQMRTMVKQKVVHWTLICVVVGWLCFGAVRWISKAVSNHVLKQQGQEWLEMAQIQSKYITNREEAIRWLRSNGFKVLIGLDNNIYGWKELSKGGIFTNPGWIAISFEFSSNGKLHDIQKRVHYYDFPLD